jgi:hypothetical protein
VDGFETRPPLLPAVAVSGLILLGTIGITCFACLAIRWCAGITRGHGGPLTAREVAASVLLTASLAQIPAMIPWVVTGALHDRYLLTVLPGLLVFSASKLIKCKFFIIISLLYIMIFWFLGFAFAADYSALTRARAALFKYLIVQGVPRTEIDGGYEFNADTQLLSRGQLLLPRGSIGRYIQYTPKHFPVMDARYRLSAAPDPDPRSVDPVPMAGATYRSPLRRKDTKIYIYKIIRQ